MASCKDCICYSGCSGILNDFGMRLNPAREVCDRFEDHARFVELPCKVGDTLYTVVRGYKIREWIVTDICFSDYLPISVMVITARDKRNSEHIRFADHYLGKTVFLTREAAEQALKGRENNG